MDDGRDHMILPHLHLLSGDDDMGGGRDLEVHRETGSAYVAPGALH